ncbi:MAG: aspartate-semialdehyde dehydrogenase [Chloroflexota bacterium]|nr:aspartate-semialdehyde dehydrogenase [Chloroflexota bacterium]
MQGVNIGIVGATGAVGQEFIKILESRHPDAHSIKLFASHRSAGTFINVNGIDIKVEETTERSFDDVDIAFISVSTEISKRFAPIAVRSGAVVIDDGSAFRMDTDVPLVIPEVNGSDVEWHKGIISIPNCSTTPLVMVAHALRQLSPITRIVADTYQSVSGAGASAMNELTQQTQMLLEGKSVESSALPNQIGFNIFPHIDSFLDTGYTREEQKMIDESRKILHCEDLPISATCVRVPVYISHCVAAHIEFESPVSADSARSALSAMPGVTVSDDPQKNIYPTPNSAAGSDDVIVGRIRQDLSKPNGLVLWIAADNLRKGAALNSIQIAEELILRKRLQPAT